jgi:hypothetical protein
MKSLIHAAEAFVWCPHMVSAVGRRTGGDRRLLTQFGVMV